MNDAFIWELWEGEEPGALCSIMRHVSPCTEHLALRVSRVARQITDLSGGLRLAERAASRAERAVALAQGAWDSGLAESKKAAEIDASGGISPTAGHE